MIEDERRKIKEELSALCLQVGLHPDTFNDEQLVEDEVARRIKYAERSN
jgi:hypothetical protein